MQYIWPNLFRYRVNGDALNKELAVEIRRTIQLLISEDEEAYLYERATALFRLQTWMLFPLLPNRMRRLADLLAGTKLLEELERRRRKKSRGQPGSAKLLAELLKTDSYATLYDACIGRHRGWARLAQEMTMERFDRMVSKRVEVASTAARMVEYRLRYLDHNGGNKKNANITHALVYSWYDHQNNPPVISKKKLLKAWKPCKESAVFLYILKRPEFQLLPAKTTEKDFVSKLSEQANDFDMLRQFFGECAYVANCLGETGPKGNLARCFPDVEHLLPVRPNTDALSPEVLQRFLQEYPGPHGWHSKFDNS